jgi:hypothetical protein
LNSKPPVIQPIASHYTNYATRASKTAGELRKLFNEAFHALDIPMETEIRMGGCQNRSEGNRL